MIKESRHVELLRVTRNPLTEEVAEAKKTPLDNTR